MSSFDNGSTGKRNLIMDKPNLTVEQIREQLSMDIVLKLGQMGYKLDDNGLLAVCTAAYDITKAVTYNKS
jgi:hypothetical protein